MDKFLRLELDTIELQEQKGMSRISIVQVYLQVDLISFVFTPVRIKLKIAKRRSQTAEPADVEDEDNAHPKKMTAGIKENERKENLPCHWPWPALDLDRTSQSDLLLPPKQTKSNNPRSTKRLRP
jgi:hypothetical protein